jgi:hypothetical protein
MQRLNLEARIYGTLTICCSWVRIVRAYSLLPLVHADQVNFYVFGGANGLAGAFTLDATALTLTNRPGAGIGYTVISPLNALTGFFGLFTFGGSDILGGFTALDPNNILSSTWIIRALPPLSGNVVNGRSVTGLNLIITYPFEPVRPTLDPPIPDEPTIFNFAYFVAYSDGTGNSGVLNTLQLVSVTTVPEPPSLITLALSCVGIFLIPLLPRYRMRPGPGWDRTLAYRAIVYSEEAKTVLLTLGKRTK